MRFERAFIPVGGVWSSPFARWQGPLAEMSSLDLAVTVTARALEDRNIPAQAFSQLVLGWTIPQPGVFYGASTVASRIGAPNLAGPMVAQACATSAAAITSAAHHVESSGETAVLAVLTDRTSNGPLLVYPSASSPGGRPRTENWVLDNFAADPLTNQSMVQTAENVAAEAGIDRHELDEVTLLRYDQYATALENDRAFQRRYMVPVQVPSRKTDPDVVDSDVGVRATSAEQLATLEPVEPGGVVTYGSQTHPADGTAGVIVASRNRAAECGRDGSAARLLSCGFARAGPAQMPKAPVPAARTALRDAGLDFDDLHAVVTHNPFTVNDIWFSRQTGVHIAKMNIHGSSLVYGHPQAPTGARLVAELIETLVLRGGGYGLFTGCAAGDSAGALVIEVDS